MSWRSLLAAIRRSAKGYLHAIWRDKILNLCPRQLPMSDGKIGGAIGVSGVLSSQDAQVARAGIDGLK